MSRNEQSALSASVAVVAFAWVSNCCIAWLTGLQTILHVGWANWINWATTYTCICRVYGEL